MKSVIKGNAIKPLVGKDTTPGRCQVSSSHKRRRSLIKISPLLVENNQKKNHKIKNKRNSGGSNCFIRKLVFHKLQKLIVCVQEWVRRANQALG